MLIGIDLDNTIINYDPVFKSILINKNIKTKNIKNYKKKLKNILNPVEWTKLQGNIYGNKIINAEIYCNFINFLNFTKKNNIEVAIISHKTKYPYIGKKVDLHKSAKKFLKKKLVNYKYKKEIYFENPTIKSTNAIQEELEFFAASIEKNETPVVSLNDGAMALSIAHKIIACIEK